MSGVADQTHLVSEAHSLFQWSYEANAKKGSITQTARLYYHTQHLCPFLQRTASHTGTETTEVGRLQVTQNSMQFDEAHNTELLSPD